MKVSQLYLLTAIVVSLSGLPTPAPAQPINGPLDFMEQFKAADRNNDGQVSRAELVNYRSTQWARIDRNGDGYFSRQDLPGFAQGRWDGEKIVGLRQMYDRNNDGRISRAEFVDGPSPAFDAADTNDDGVVNAAEMRSLAAQARG